ncbi:MAG: helicase C-terminal domain-containing protein, partial [Succinatimonas hippei]|nr:helicase C-terminal domain-containing protein [Succinatimonas hippei]
AQNISGFGRGRDNMLTISSDGRDLSLDPRLYDPNCPEDPNDSNLKVNQLVERVLKIAKDNPDQGQAIFCDRGTPGKDKFNVYAEIKNKLVAAGMKSSEIAFIHNFDTPAKKQKLFDDFNNGKVKVILGSTEKLGTGVNIQERLKAIHHLDINWKPSDIEQRNGRIIRQGNSNPEVDVYFYIGNRTFDSFMFQTVMRKADAFNQVMQAAVHGDTSERTLNFDSSETLSYSQCMSAATGNPLWNEQVELSSQIKNLENQQKAFESQLRDAKEKADRILPERIISLGKQHQALNEAAKVLDAHNAELGKDGEGFSMVVYDKDGAPHKFDKRADARKALTEKIKNVPLMRGFMNDPNEATKVATWGGIDIYVSTAQKSMFNEQTHVNTPYLAGYLSFKFSGTSTVIKRTENPLFDHVLTSNENNHNLTQIANAFEGLRNGIGAVAAEMKSLQNDLENTKAYVATNQGFSKSGELLQKRQRLNEIDKLLAESGATKVPEYDPSEKVTETVIEYDPNVYDPNFFNNAIKASKAKQNADEVQNENAEAQDVRSVTTGVKPSEMGAKFTEVKTDEAITAEPEDLKEHSEDLNSEQLKQQSAESVKDQSPLDLENSLRVAMGLKPKGQNEDTLNNNLPKRSVACEKALKQLKTNAEDLKDEVCYGRGL